MPSLTDRPTTTSWPAHARRKTSLLKHWLREAHFWVGIVLCVPFVLLGLSGSYLTYQDEIEALAGGGAPSASTMGVLRPPVEVIVASWQAADAGFAPVMLTMPSEPGTAALVRLAPEGATLRDPRAVTMAIDPVSLEPLGPVTSPLAGLSGLMHGLHGSLLLGGAIGRPAVGIIGIAMLVLGLSGLVLWWPRRGQVRQALTVKVSAHGYRFHRDLHGAIGIWTLTVFLVVSATGVWISFPQPMNSLAEAVFGTRASQASDIPIEPASPPRPGTLPVLANLAEAAQDAVPNATLRLIALPFRPGMGVRAILAYPGMAEGAPPVMMQMDVETAVVTSLSDPRSYGIAEALSAWQRPLHEGQGWGPVWRVLVFGSGLLPLLFVVTGLTMWQIKRRNRRRMASA